MPRKMKGILIYDEIGRKRNTWFIDKLISEAERFSLNIALTSPEKAIEENASFAIVRTIDPILTHTLEAKGIKVFNNSKTAEIANDKWKTYLFAKNLGIPTMQTCLNEPFKEYPFVLKSLDGHGGSEVFWISCQDEYQEITKKLHSIGKRYLTQAPAKTLGVDVRIFLIGTKVVGCVKRYNDNSFKSNYSLGGNVEKFEPTNEQIEIATTLAKELDSDYIGVDFIYNGGWVLNEIEDVCGARTLYATTNEDIAIKYLQRISDKLNV